MTKDFWYLNPCKKDLNNNVYHWTGRPTINTTRCLLITHVCIHTHTHACNHPNTITTTLVSAAALTMIPIPPPLPASQTYKML